MHDGPTISLPAGQLFSLPDAASARILCTAGTLWLTLDHDLRDVILEPGDSFSTQDHRRALLYALKGSSFVLTQPACGGGVPAKAARRPAPVWSATPVAGAA